MMPILSLEKFLVVLLIMKQNNNDILVSYDWQHGGLFSSEQILHTQSPQKGDIIKKAGTSTVVDQNNQESALYMGEKPERLVDKKKDIFF